MRTDVVKDAMSKMAKLATEIEESSSDVIDYGLVSHPMTCPHDKLWRAMHPSSLGQLIAGCKLMACPSKRRVMRSMRLFPDKVSTDNVQTIEAAP